MEHNNGNGILLFQNHSSKHSIQGGLRLPVFKQLVQAICILLQPWIYKAFVLIAIQSLFCFSNFLQTTCFKFIQCEKHTGDRLTHASPRVSGVLAYFPHLTDCRRDSGTRSACPSGHPFVLADISLNIEVLWLVISNSFHD